MTETALVITISTRAAAGVYADTSGLIIVDGLRDLGFEVTEPLVVPDGDDVGAALRSAVAAEHAVVITTGGTGLHPNDHTPGADPVGDRARHSAAGDGDRPLWRRSWRTDCGAQSRSRRDCRKDVDHQPAGIGGCGSGRNGRAGTGAPACREPAPWRRSLR